MSTLTSQSISRGSIINGRFLAGVAAITIMFASMVRTISGLELRVLGILSSTPWCGGGLRKRQPGLEMVDTACSLALREYRERKLGK